ncbi:MAG: SAM-dependent DNA methyltransferase, partial [Anaerolineae bacterium]|nr:SAM-dependent DNA methyltransferase [Anaerolineae bacterium]
MTPTSSNGAALGFEATLWAAADKLRGHLDAADYKHVVLGLIFLKYISDAFEEKYEQLRLWASDPHHPYYVKDEPARYQIVEDRDEYLAENIFWVPREARWHTLQAQAKDPKIGLLIDKAMRAIERENPSLKGVLPQDYGRADLDKRRLGELVDLIGAIGLGDKESRNQDILGRVYEYFLGQFADAEGKKGGEFYTPQSIVKLLVAMLQPYHGRIFDPCCGSGGMFVQSEKFVEAHGGRLGDIAIYGQESNPTTWKLCKMNLAIRSIEGDLGAHAADSFHDDLHLDLKVDFILANPPFNMSDWGGALLEDDVRWAYGTPPTGNANYAWIQHFIHHLAADGQAGFVLANGSMSTQQSGEGDIRRRLVEADLVACMVALPPQLFYNTQIPACLWFLDRAKPAHRRGQTLFIDARDLGELVSRVRRELTGEDIARIAAAYRTWRAPEGQYQDAPGFCASADAETIAGHGHILTPGRYVGFAEEEDDGEPFEEKMERLTATLAKQ